MLRLEMLDKLLEFLQHNLTKLMSNLLKFSLQC